MTKGTEIGAVRGLGSAHHGAGHWLLMQATSAGSLITCAYLVFSFLLLEDLSYATVTGWLEELGPSSAILTLNLAAFAGAAFGLLCLVRIGLGAAA